VSYLNNNETQSCLRAKVCDLEEAQIYEDNNTYFGDLSAILIENMPIWAEFSSTPSNKTSLMSNWETKMDAIITETKREKMLLV
jgi:hypothetical protein